MKKTTLEVKAAIFDMDGVITNTMPDHYMAWKKIFDAEGIPISRYEIYRREGQPGINTVNEIFASEKRSISRKEAASILKRKENLFKKIVKIRFINGARSFIKSLHNNNCILALVTGTARHELHKILPKSIYDLFSVVITGSDVKKGKPDPEPYLLALKKLNLKPSEAVVIENAPFGISSAKAAGLRCLAVETSLSSDSLKKADLIFDSIGALRKKMQFIPKNTGSL